MNNDLKNRITSELEYYHSFKLNPENIWNTHLIDDKNWLENIHIFINTTKNGLIDYGNECIPDEEYSSIIKFIKKSGNSILIKSSNAYDSPYGFHPLTNIAIWNGHTMPDKNIYNNNTDMNSYVIPLKAWSDTNLINPNTKSNRYLLSVRRGTPIRDSLFKKIKESERKWDCIVRYSNYNEFKQTAEFNYTTSHILNEYKESFITFVVETIYKGTYDIELNHSINLTEKTLFAYNNKTIPLFFGCKNLVKSLKKIGFYTFDDFFNLDIDNIETFDERRQDLYLKCLKYIDAMNQSELFSIYSKLFPKIEHNYKLVNYLFELNHAIEKKHDTLARFTKNLDNSI